MRSRMLLFGVCVGCGWAWAGQPLRLELKWQELESRVARKKVAFTLPDGTRVEGKAIAVQADGLRMKVSKTSDRKAQPKGERVIPRAELSVLRVTSYRKLGRLLGTLGAAAAAGGIVAAQSIDIYGGPLVIIVPAVVAGGLIGTAIGGYYAGKVLDKRVTEIRIVPEGTR